MTTKLVPVRDDLVDAAFLTALFAVALFGFHTTYTGWSFLLVGAGGLLLGMLVGHLANGLRQPLITVAFMTVAVFFLLGGAIALRGQVGASPLPTPGTVLGLADLGVHGWKQLLTTLPPVDGGGPLVVIPYILGLLCGSGGLTLARRIPLAAAPVFAPFAVLVAVILLGTGEAASGVLQGVGFCALALFWSGVRASRRRAAVRDGSGTLVKVATAAALVGVAAGVVALVGPFLPGAGGEDRLVLRNHVEPPFEIGAYSSPLVGFRKYTKDANRLWDQTLFKVKGLPAGETVRIAALDGYDGSVWGATSSPAGATSPLERNNFQRVGTRIPTRAAGTEATVEITIEPAYASADDVNAWLPNAGHPTVIDFAGERAAANTDNLRFNLATSSGIVVDRLRAGDSYTLRTVLGSSAVPEDAQPFGRPAVVTTDADFVTAKVAKWVGGASGTGGKLRAVAAYLRDNGAYSDGGPGETEYLPGHSAGRLTSFFNASRPVGDDEQYAAAYALVANQIGMPARVVLGATPDAEGIVRGQDVRAYVEIHLADGTWVPISNTEFMPDKSKKPDQQPPQQIENTDASIVPPPNTVKLPGSLIDSSQVDANSNRRTTDRDNAWELPAWLITAITWTGAPVLVVALLVGSVIGLKARRRALRRSRGSTDTRFAKGWRELVDHARDLGLVVPAGRTRLEEAAHLDRQDLLAMATAADATVFGPGQPAERAAADYWAEVQRTRRAMSASVGRLRRWRAAVSLQSFRRPATGGAA